MKLTPVALMVFVVSAAWLGAGGGAACAEPPRSGDGGNALSQREVQALESAKRHLAAGGQVDAPLQEGASLLGWPADPVTRLHEAAENGWLAVARYLLDHGANPSAVVYSKSHYNQLRPTDIALTRGHKRVLRLLKERCLPTIGEARTLSIDVGPDEDALAFISLEEGRWARLSTPDIGTTTAADIMISPHDHVIYGLDGVHQNFKHLGDDAAVARFSGASLPPGYRAPVRIDWQVGLQDADVRKGAQFLVRSTVGAIFHVHLLSLDLERGTATLRYVRLEPGRATSASGVALPDAVLAAIAAGDADGVRRILLAGLDWKARGQGGQTLLHAAAASGEAATAEAVLDIAMTGGQGGMVPADRYLDAREAILEAHDAHGMTPLHVASYGGHADVVRILLAQSADPKALDAKGRTPLHLAAMANRAAVTRLLVEKGARIRWHDDAGKMPEELTSDPALRSWFQAVNRKHPDPDEVAVKALLEDLVGAVRTGDRASLSLLLPAEDAAGVPDPFPGVPCTPRLESFRLRGRKAEASVVLTLKKPTPYIDALLLTVTFEDPDGTGTWRIQGSKLSSHV